MWEVKKKISVCETWNPVILPARRVKLCSLNANVLFEELHQLTKFA